MKVPLKLPRGVCVNVGRKATGGGEERSLSIWRFGHWEIELILWRSL